MNKEIIQISTTSGSMSIEIDVPYDCVHCGNHMKPSRIFVTKYNSTLRKNVGILYQCTHCHQFFACEYEVGGVMNSTTRAFPTKLIDYSYKKLVEFDLPDETSIISPTFKEIYIQALTAEQNGLNQISGIGYRKAIEFLIKDFLITFQCEDRETVSTIPLGQAVNRLSSDRIKSLSKAAVWLGNDESHYVRKYNDKDVSDMKKFVKALSYFISSEMVASEASDFIES